MAVGIRRMERKKLNNREDWLKNRLLGLGASESAAVVGLSPWLSNIELWDIKTGNKKPKDMSGNADTERGHRMEPTLRELFLAMNEQYECEYHEFDLVYQSERPWLYATLDGELTEKETGRKGVLEIKTSAPQNKAAWAKWQDRIPDYYMVQTLHQLLATGYDFVVLFAALFGQNGQVFLRTYSYDRDMVQDELKWLLDEETKFWESVQQKKMPGMRVTI